MNRKFNKSGQVTMFIIIALVVVALAALIYFLYPKIKSGFAFEEETPEKFIQTCLESDIGDTVDLLSSQGGSLAPEHYILYKGDKIEYLCYQEENYKTCVIQQPLLKKHIEAEINKNIQTRAKLCFDQMQKKYQDSGYDVNLKRGEMQVELLPKRVVVSFNSSLALTKGGSSQRIESFRVILNNNLYELVAITNSILEWEAKYGDAESTVYMTYYKDLKVEKSNQLDGSTIYILTDRNNGFKFQFASRSVVWPPGYG
ncbi:hypothetical protein HY212_01920 [Candidatus Pacearchaeota archaeon]|nr:hypothetical protein [Candidatus Pacearchaeota archaeon]